MNFDILHMWTAAGVGWFLVTIMLTARRWQEMLAAMIAWIVSIDVFATLSSAIDPLLRNAPHSQGIGFAFLVLPYAVLLWLVVRFRLHARKTISEDHETKPNARP